MAGEQQISIKKTVWIIVAVMVTILTLFIHKITTPRYLSQIELKINGLVLFGKNNPQTIESLSHAGSSWMLLVDTEEERQLFKEIMPLLDNSVKTKIVVKEEADIGDTQNIQQQIQTSKSIIPLIKPNGEYIGYFVSPYDNNKVILTLSSVVTHR
ncbi:hypothetical protein ACVBE9_09535 [Eionea flava]